MIVYVNLTLDVPDERGEWQEEKFRGEAEVTPPDRGCVSGPPEQCREPDPGGVEWLEFVCAPRGGQKKRVFSPEEFALLAAWEAESGGFGEINLLAALDDLAWEALAARQEYEPD